MTGLNEKKDTGTKSKEELQRLVDEKEKQKYTVLQNAANGYKYRYKSSNDPNRFLKYLESRVSKWEHLSTRGGSGTTYAKAMLEKTNFLITKLDNEITAC